MELPLWLAKAARAMARSRPAPFQGVGRRGRGSAARRGRGDAAFFATLPWEEAKPAIGPDVTGGDTFSGPIGEIGRDKFPIYVDWTRYGAVTTIGDQGDTDSCYHWAAAAALEGKFFIDTKKHLLDANCLRNYGAYGGLSYESFMYIKNNGGVVLDEYYPYVGVQGPPKLITAPGVTLDNAVMWLYVKEYMLKALVAQQPVCATIGADDNFFYGLQDGDNVLDGYNYTIDEMADMGISHAVLVVAYGETKTGKKVWVAKSSHGGDRFVLIARDTRKVGGAFGITSRITYPTRKSCSSDVVDVTVRSDKVFSVEPRLEFWPEDYKVPE